MHWKHNIFLKKARRYAYNTLRTGNATQYSSKAVLCNSFPKSGTHLLHQILSSQNHKDYGNFIASTPSLTMKLHGKKQIVKACERLFNNELVSGHIFWSSDVTEALKHRSIANFFIFRDPRDVMISECHYLSKMNKWHRLHKYFSRCKNLDEMIELSIKGIQSSSFYYPNIGERMSRYTNWISENSTCSMKYEDLFVTSTEEILEGVYDYWLTYDSSLPTKDRFIRESKQAINPSASHTFRSGSIYGWKTYLNERLHEEFLAVAGVELDKWGYSSAR